MSQIVEPKTYTGKDLETIFFRPIFSGPDAKELGIRIMYNMPVPTTLNFWRGASDILQKYTVGGWNGGKASEKFQKTIELARVKAEVGYSASDYFSMVFEQITNRADINMEDLTGTELEEAETRLFKEAIAESIRATMWLGYADRENGPFSTFDGFIMQIIRDLGSDSTAITNVRFDPGEYETAGGGEALLKEMWNKSSDVLKEMKNQGELAFFVTSDVYAKYEESLDSATLEAAYIARQEGRGSLSYRGIPVVDVQVSGYLSSLREFPKSFALLTDRRNLALAVNTADFPGTEVRMWYNPDEMENRQRAVFMAGCDYLLPELMTVAFVEV